ncbi:uncharacterized protein LOC126899396 isoform X5 [Daktulosphaira vitifoliae]|uniref:uncharacterized protein LOC126899396 isoform X5 n=1 Tax=Daktulosphaira vitifoliae TaxID=58002 RepID=UPI0021AA2305|nr:uncharacterized protein LOC126899396 isoform X5 [Daktulosphaira vitifoliae]
MTSLKIVLKCFLLFYIILRIESENNKIENTRIVNNLFKCIGWKNLKRVKNVTYLWKNYDLPSIIQQPITPIDCNKKIRIATVFLGCIYISIIMDIMSAVNYQRIFCDEIMSNEFNKTQGYNCTLKLLEIMTNFTLFTKKIQGALYAIDSLHRYPWKLSDKSYIILNFISEDFQNLQSQLDKWSPSRDDLGYNKSILCTILFEMENIKMKILCNTRQFCTLESDNIFVLTNNLNILYKNIDLNGENIAVYYSGSEIILNGIEMFILENFTKLGFKFDLYNGETFIPNSLLHLFTEANNESKSSPATNPVVHDFLQKVENTRIMNNLFKCVGWKNLKYIKNVTYLYRNKDLSSIIEEPITPKTCNSKIRAMTVFLGCTYANILLDIVTAVNCQRIFCEQIMNNEIYKLHGYNCTVKLLEIISNIILFTKKIQGALYTIDKLHTHPWINGVKYSIILKLVFDEFQNLQGILYDFPSCEYLTYNKTILHKIEKIMKHIEIKIDFNIELYCTLECGNVSVLTNKLNVIYNNVKFNGENIELYNFGSETILSEIEIMITNFFTKLGFEFNLETGETFIPDSLDHLFGEAVNESETSPATNPDCYDFLQKEAINEPETSLATNPVFYDFLQKEEAVNKSETSLAMNPAYYDFLQKEAVNELETSQATNPVFYDFLQKDLIGDTIMNEETDIEKGELTKKYPQHFIKFL